MLIEYDFFPSLNMSLSSGFDDVALKAMRLASWRAESAATVGWNGPAGIQAQSPSTATQQISSLSNALSLA